MDTRAIPAYWDDLQVTVEATPGTAYEVEVAGDAAFDALLTDAAGLSGTSRADTLRRYETAYYWRVRAASSGRPARTPRAGGRGRA